MSAAPTMLQFDWEGVHGATVTAVVAKGARAMNDGTLDCEMIAFILGASAVVIRVNDDTDEVLVTLQETETCTDWPPLVQLSDIVSRGLGWCWLGQNYLGYLDTFMLGLDGIDPAYAFTAAGSSLQCMRLTAIVA